MISIDDFHIIRGKLPPRAYGLVVEWAMEHKAELLQNWSKAIAAQPLANIKPLR